MGAVSRSAAQFRVANRDVIGSSTGGDKGQPAYGAIRSPFGVFCLWIVLCVFLFQLRWSSLFGDVYVDTWIILAIAFAVFFALSRAHRPALSGVRPLPVERATLCVVTGYFVAAIVLNHGVPLIQILRGEPYDIYSFGIPNLHVLMLSFAGYYGIRAFNAFLEAPTWWKFFPFLWILGLLVLIANRSAVSFLMFGCAVLYLRRKRVRMLRLTVGVGLVAGLLLLFGQFGNARLDFQVTQATGQAPTTGAFSNISQPTPAFDSTRLPAASMWPYMYLASPLANMNQAAIDNDGHFCGQSCDLAGLVVYQLVPDMLGSRVGRLLHLRSFDKSAFLIRPDVTASSTFGSAIGYAGILGAIVMIGWLAIVGVVSLQRVVGTAVMEEGIALLGCLFFFSFFENMIAYSALSLQIVWVLIRARTNARYL